MNKLGVKKWMAFALILVSAIACFSAVGILPTQLKNFFNKEVLRDVDYIDIGIEYKDGWYLIKDSEDYYAMRDAVNSGVGQGFKYRLENDIEIDSRAGLNVFSGTLDGNGHTFITVDNEPEYEEDIKAGAISIASGSTAAGYRKNDTDELTDNANLGDGVFYGYGISTDILSYSASLGLQSWRRYSGGEYSLDGNIANTYCFGAIGILKSATLTNFNVEYSGDIKIDADAGITGSSLNIYVGGLVGYAYNSTIKNCMVRFTGGAKIVDTGSNAWGKSNIKIGGICGVAYGSSDIQTCLVITDDGRTPINAPECRTAAFSCKSDNETLDHVGSCYTISANQASALSGGTASFWNGKPGFKDKVATSWTQIADCEWVCIGSAPIVGTSTITSSIIQKVFIDYPEYTVIADPNGGVWSNGSSSVKTFNDVIEDSNIGNVISPSPTRTGYQFRGWYTSASGGTQVSKITSDIRVYAHWSASWYVLTATAGDGIKFLLGDDEDDFWLISNDEKSATLDVEYQSVVTKFPTTQITMANPEQYDIKWYNSSGSNISSITVTGDSTITCELVPKASYKLIIQYYDTHAFKVVSGGTTITYKITDQIELPTCTLSYYTGTVFKVSSRGTGSSWAIDSTYTAGSTISAGMYGDATLQLQLTPKSYTITLEITEGGSISSYSPSGLGVSYSSSTKKITYNYGSSFNLPSQTHVKASDTTKTFAGWEVSVADGNWSQTLSPGANISGKYGNVTLTTKWNSNLSRLRFSDSEKKLVVADQYLNSVVQNSGVDSAAYEGGGDYVIYYLNNGAVFYLPDANNTLNSGTNKLLSGWYKDYAGSYSSWENKSDYSAGEYIVNPTGSVALYAVWGDAVDCYVYMIDGGNPMVMLTSYTRSADNQIPTLTAPDAPAGYTFGGWSYIRLDGGGVTDPYTSDGELVITGFTYGNIYVSPVWVEIPKSTLSVDPNGGLWEGSTSVQTFTNEIETAMTIADPERLGYTFNGWALTGGGTFNLGIYIHGDTDGTLTAVWEIEVFIITYELDGGSASGNPTTYTVETETFTLNNPTKTGYTFDGWTGSNGDTASTTVTITKGSTGDKTYTANWSTITYTITYNLDGGSVSTANPTSYTVDTETFTLNNPTKLGYDFDGWTGTDVDTASITVTIASGSTGDRTYTANWSAIIYTISYDLNDADPTMSKAEHSREPSTYTIETETFSLLEPIRAGYTFDGWTGTDVDTASTRVTIPQGSTGDRSYTAHWTIITYTIAYELDGGSVSTANPTSYTVETETFTLNNPTKSGYDFDGWTGTDVATASTIVTIEKGSTGDREYTAHWTIIIYTITYDLNDADPTMSKVEHSREPSTYTIETETFSLVEPTRAGYTFDGWTGTDVDTASTTVTIPQGSTGDRNYTAHWSVIKYTITLDNNPNSSTQYGDIDDSGMENYTPYEKSNFANLTYNGGYYIEYTIEDTIVFPTSAHISKQYHIFSGWIIADAPNTVAFEVIDSRAKELKAGSYGDAQLDLDWTAIIYTIQLNLNPDSGTQSTEWQNSYIDPLGNVLETKNGNTSTLIKYTVNNDTFELPTGNQDTYDNDTSTKLTENLYRRGYIFLGWTIKSEDEDILPDPDSGYVLKIKHNSHGNAVLDAIWQLETYEIQIDLTDGTIADRYATDISKQSGEYDKEDCVIRYDVEDEIDLPAYATVFANTQIYRSGYIFKGWVLSSVTSVELGVEIDSRERTGFENNTTIDYATPQYVIKGSVGSAKITAQWEEMPYSITFDPNGGEIRNYDPYDKNGTDGFSGFEDNKIAAYTIDNVFDLPSRGESGEVDKWPQIYRLGYTAISWEVVSVSLEYVREEDKANNNWYTELEDGTKLNYIYGANNNKSAYEVCGKIGNVVLRAVWVENTYNIELHANYDNTELVGSISSTKTISNIGYSSVVTINGALGTANVTAGVTPSNGTVTSATAQEDIELGWKLASTTYKFVGWAYKLPTGSNLYGSNPTYEYLYINERDGDGYIYEIVGEQKEEYSLSTCLTDCWDTKLVKDGLTLQYITLGDYENSQTVVIYAIWTPIYTFTIHSNIAEKDLDNADAGIFTDGNKLKNSSGESVTVIQQTNDYYTQYNLYSQEDTEVFNKPVSALNRLFYYGYYIQNWIVKIGNYYYLYDALSNTSTEITANNTPDKEWVKGDANARVDSGINMQYLQGNIEVTPMWQPIKFDVRVQIKSTETYKTEYKNGEELDDLYTVVTFDSGYTINESSVSGTWVQTYDIQGYQSIYAHPRKSGHNTGTIDTNTTIIKKGNWSYRLQYQQYSKHQTYGDADKTADVKWFVVVEAYYAPDLYRIELNLQLPYTTNNDFKLNNNGYDICSVTQEEYNDGYLKSRYENLVISNGTYIVAEEYGDKQGNIYQVGDKYYIYLFQDQIIKDETVYDRYSEGKEISNPTSMQGKLLPSFEISYYQMQYYYTQNITNINLYPMCSVNAEEYEAGAKAKIQQRVADAAFTKYEDWKYSYCVTNYEDAPQNYQLKVYWYRNIINVDIENILANSNTLNGYTLITEEEQVVDVNGVKQLEGHNKYHLVIYTLYNDTYQYVTYAFDELSVLKDGKYKYPRVLEQYCYTGNSFPIYFGNRFTVEAVDQSGDDSLDIFIGYRFKEYEYSMYNKQGNPITDSNRAIIEYDNKVIDPENPENYKVVVNLQNYEHGRDGNNTNYFNDKDRVNIKVYFEKIQYTFIFKPTDEMYEAQSYGSIRLNYSKNEVQDTQISYTVTVDEEKQLLSRMLIRLGSELLRWDLRNTDLNSAYIYTFETDEDAKVALNGQILSFVVNVQFLRTHLYELSTNPNPYSAKLEQTVGDVNAVCRDIDFDVKVVVNDLSTSTVIREYLLTDEGLENEIFTITNGAKTISVDNSYELKMIDKRESDEYVYYYQDNVQYVLRRLYIVPSLTKSTKLLINEFGYPLASFDNIVMNVNYVLLDGSVNYTQFVNVAEEDRVVVFNIDVAPTYELIFKTSTNAQDIFKGERKVLVENTLIASAIDGEYLALVNDVSEMKYLGYWGQETLLLCNASTTYYTALRILVEGATPIDMLINGNARYSVAGETTITLEFIPKTCSIDAYAVYQGEQYNTTNEASGERKAITEMVNASGIAIFAEDGIRIISDSNNVGATTGLFYPGDKIYVSHTLNSVLEKDFNVSIYNNGIGPDKYVVGKGFEIQLGGEDIVLKFVVTPKVEAVTITTNMPEFEYGEVYGQINDGEITKVDGEGIFTLINGDKLSIYLKEEMAYEFLNEYIYKENNTKHSVTPEEASGEYAGFKKFVLFEETGFATILNGIYVLVFRQVDIEIGFKYYEIIPELKEAEAGSNYMATSEDEIIQKGSIITINEGIDEIGYRFVDYSYGAGSGENRKELNLTIIDETKQQFEIDETIIEYIYGEVDKETWEIGESQLKLEIYVNYIKQYKYEVNYTNGSEGKIRYEIENEAGERMSAGYYYDYGTNMKIVIEAEDSIHYQVKVGISSNGEDEEISTNQREGIENIKESNNGNLSGFEISKVMESDYSIILEAIAEIYNTVLKMNMNDGQTINTIEIDLQGKNGEIFQIMDTVYCQVEATHEYGSVVNVKFYVIDTPKEGYDDRQYYKFKELTLNGQKIGSSKTAIGTIEERECSIYEVTYSLRGADLPIEQELSLLFNAMYYVKVN